MDFFNISGNLGEKVITDLAISFAGGNLPGLVSNLASNAINTSKIKIIGKVAVRVGNGFTLFLFEWRYESYYWDHKILKYPNVLIDGITEAVKHWIKTRRWISFIIYWKKYSCILWFFLELNIYPKKY